jgi:hypothetical protein
MSSRIMMNSDTHIPVRFEQAITLHILKNLIADLIDWRAPLLLGIHGASGEGKTFQCEQILRKLGIHVVLVSSGELESEDAGIPAKIIRSRYLAAGMMMSNDSSAVVLINDFDTGIGNWGDLVQYTVNRQHVIGELMHLVDYPNSVEGRSTPRVPILLTGNDFTKLYTPLIRAGRMASFQWTPSSEERASILEPLLGLTAAEIMSLTRELQLEANNLHGAQNTPLPIAFFAHLMSTMVDDQLVRLAEEFGSREMIRRLRARQVPLLSTDVSYDELLLRGRSLVASGVFVNHLKGV